MNTKAFFDAVRSTVFKGKLSTTQVQGLDLIISEANRRGINNEYLAYCLATTAHETAYTMQPIHERGARSYFNKYDAGTRIGKVLGNTKAGDGYLFRGRGYVQLTGRSNYERAARKLGVDCVNFPDLVLQPKNAVVILFDGMLEGWFTGKKLADYLDGIDEDDKEDLREFSNARRIINGTDKQVEIGQLALKFEKALRGALRPEKLSLEPVKIPEAPKPTAPGNPTPAPLPVAPVGLIAKLVAWLAKLFAKA